MAKLNDAYRDMLEREIPGLTALFPDWVKHFNVQKVDLDTLSLRSSWAHGSYEDVIYSIEGIYLLDRKREVIGWVGVRQVERHRPRIIRWILGDKVTVDDEIFYESTGEAIERFRDKEIKYVLRLSRDDSSATLYKVPKSTSLAQHIEEKKGEEQKRLAEFLQDG